MKPTTLCLLCWTKTGQTAQPRWRTTLRSSQCSCQGRRLKTWRRKRLLQRNWFVTKDFCLFIEKWFPVTASLLWVAGNQVYSVIANYYGVPVVPDSIPVTLFVTGKFNEISLNFLCLASAFVYTHNYSKESPFYRDAVLFFSTKYFVDKFFKEKKNNQNNNNEKNEKEFKTEFNFSRNSKKMFSFLYYFGYIFLGVIFLGTFIKFFIDHMAEYKSVRDFYFAEKNEARKLFFGRDEPFPKEIWTKKPDFFNLRFSLEEEKHYDKYLRELDTNRQSLLSESKKLETELENLAKEIEDNGALSYSDKKKLRRKIDGTLREGQQQFSENRFNYEHAIKKLKKYHDFYPENYFSLNHCLNQPNLFIFWGIQFCMVLVTASTMVPLGILSGFAFRKAVIYKVNQVFKKW